MWIDKIVGDFADKKSYLEHGACQKAANRLPQNSEGTRALSDVCGA